MIAQTSTSTLASQVSTFHCWLTKDPFGVRLWGECPEYDFPTGCFHGGETIAMDAALMADFPVPTLLNIDTPMLDPNREGDE